MPKYLVEASYTVEGLRGLAKDKASGRRKAVSQSFQALGGKVEAMYYVFGERDAIVIGDLPDNVTAAGLAMAVAASGLVNIKTTPLLTVEEVDQALKKKVSYKAPGKGR